MPRLPVDGKKVQELRITFGSKERQLMEGALGAFQFNRVAEPIVKGMSDVSFMVTVASLLAIYFPDIVIPTTKDGMEQIMSNINVGVKAGMDRAKQERETTGEATLDDSTGVRDFLGRAWFNITNPNWTMDPDAPGVREAWREIID